MVIDMNYWRKVIKRIFIFFLTIIALVFLFNLVFLINTFIIGSKSKDIIKAIKNGI